MQMPGEAFLFRQHLNRGPKGMRERARQVCERRTFQAEGTSNAKTLKRDVLARSRRSKEASVAGREGLRESAAGQSQVGS